MMSLISRTHRCDWPGCGKTLVETDDGQMSDSRWEHRRVYGVDRTYIVCDEHRCYDSMALAEALLAAMSYRNVGD